MDGVRALTLPPWDPTCQCPQQAKFSFPHAQGLCSATLLPHFPGNLGDHNFIVPTTKADTGLHMPDQLFLVWEYHIQVSIRVLGCPVQPTC